MSRADAEAMAKRFLAAAAEVEALLAQVEALPPAARKGEKMRSALHTVTAAQSLLLSFPVPAVARWLESVRERWRELF